MNPNEKKETEPWTEQQRRAIFGPILQEYSRQKKCTMEEANQWMKDSLVKRGMIKDSRTEMTKENATKVIDGMCKKLNLELDSPWL